MKTKFILTIVHLCLTVFLTAQETKESAFKFKWDNGFKIESADKQHKFKFGGRIMLDHVYLNQNNKLDASFGALETTNGTEIRRARFFASGTIYENIEFKLQSDFAGGEVILKDAYIGLKNIPFVGNLRIGHVKEPFRLEMMTSSKYISFMERSFAEGFLPVRNNGIIFFNNFLEKKLSIQFGYFRNADGDTADNKSANDGYSLTGRATSLLINDVDSGQLWHVGAGFSRRKPASNEYKITSRPESHIGPKYLNTGAISDADKINFTNFETAFITGSLALQGEYLRANIDLKNSSTDYSFTSYYAQASYFLTGESRNYKSSYGGFGRVKPINNFSGENKGCGAWEVALRYSHSDMNSEDVLGGEQSDVTLGVNWYLNPATRIVLNHVWANIENAGKASVFQVRFQIDF